MPVSRRRGRNSGKSTTGGPQVPYFPQGGVMEAAKHLAYVAGKFVRSTAGTMDVEDAIGIWHRSLAEATKRDAEEKG